MSAWKESVLDGNGITILLLLIVAFTHSGMSRGASRSAGKLVFSGDAVLRLVGLAISVPFTLWLSPKAGDWLGTVSGLPNRELRFWEQIYYTAVKSLADFPLLRFAVLFMLSYAAIVFMLRLLVSLIMGAGWDSSERKRNLGIAAEPADRCRNRRHHGRSAKHYRDCNLIHLRQPES